jgi:hypothetical protein
MDAGVQVQQAAAQLWWFVSGHAAFVNQALEWP